MPYGEHRVRCMHCGDHYNCGDCITYTCFDCNRKGHRGAFFLDCPICGREHEERMARIRARVAEAGK